MFLASSYVCVSCAHEEACTDANSGSPVGACSDFCPTGDVLYTSESQSGNEHTATGFVEIACDGSSLTSNLYWPTTDF